MKIVFMGTPEFAVPSLEKLIECDYEIPMVVTQPDRRGNRGKITFSPVKECTTASTCTDPCFRNFGARRRCSIPSFREIKPPA